MFIYSEQQITATWVCVCVSAYVYITLRESYTLLTYQQQQPHHRGPWIDDWKIHVSRVLLLYWCRHHFLHFILNEKVVKKKQKEQTREKEGAPLSPVLDVDFRPPRPQLGSSGGTKTTTGWPSHRHFFCSVGCCCITTTQLPSPQRLTQKHIRSMNICHDICDREEREKSSINLPEREKPPPLQAPQDILISCQVSKPYYTQERNPTRQ